MNAIKHPIKRSFVFFLVPDFTMVAFATALDPLRLANRMLGYPAYTWRLASYDGKPVRASNGVSVSVDTSLEEERRKMAGPDRPSMVIVCSGIDVEKYQNKSVFAWLREEYNRGVAIGGLYLLKRSLHVKLAADVSPSDLENMFLKPRGLGHDQA